MPTEQCQSNLMGKFYCYAMQINARSFQLGFCFTFHLTAFTFDFVWNGFYCSNREITSWNICDKCKALNDEQYKNILLLNSICICRLLVTFVGDFNFLPIFLTHLSWIWSSLTFTGHCTWRVFLIVYTKWH